MTKSLLILAIASLLSAAAHAEDPAPPVPLTANVALTTNYKYRGQDQGNNKPAISGGFDWSASGFYIGNWNSSIGFTNAGVEMDFYGGYKGEIIKDSLSYDVGILQYYYPQKNKTVDFNTTELYGALTYGPATLKYSHTVSKDYFGWGGGTFSGRNTGYLDLSANYEVVKGLTLNGHVGYTRYSADLRDNVLVPNYYDYKVGATYDLSAVMGSGVSIAGAVVGANKKDFYGDINKTRFILTLSKSL
jgi:uncharacterized protein (TIGR02001 family)